MTNTKDAQAREILENLGALQNDDVPFPCPRCGQYTMNRKLTLNALSRYADVYICPDCGMDEAIRDISKDEPLPFSEWALPASFGK